MKYSTTTILALSSASATTASFVTQPQPAAHSSGTRSAHYDRTFALSAKNDKKDDNKDHEGLPIDLEQAKKQMMGMTDGWKKMVSNNPFGIKMVRACFDPSFILVSVSVRAVPCHEQHGAFNELYLFAASTKHDFAHFSGLYCTDEYYRRKRSRSPKKCTIPCWITSKSLSWYVRYPLV